VQLMGEAAENMYNRNKNTINMGLLMDTIRPVDDKNDSLTDGMRLNYFSFTKREK
jgi:hypothetical protein